MKSFIVLAGLLLFLCGCGRQPVKSSSTLNDLEGQGLKGNVKSLKVFTYGAGSQTGGTQRRSLKKKSTTLFNSNGCITEMSENEPDGKPRSKTTVKYDGAGNKFEQIEVNPDGKMVSKISFKYDAAGNLVGKSRWDFDEKSKPKNAWTFTFKYDDKGNMIEESASSLIGKVIGTKDVCQYGTQGNLTMSTSYDKDGKLLEKKIYNDAGYLAESQMYSGKNGGLTMKITYKYDDKSQNPGKITFWNINEANSNPIETCIYKADGSVLNKITRKNSYDEKGNLLETSQYNADGKLTSKETVSYDKEGNWLNKTINSQNVKGDIILEREMQYYPASKN